MQFQAFLDAQKHLLYLKTNSLERFTFYYLDMTKRRYLGLFRHNFRILFVSFSHTFSLPIFFYVFGCHFDDFASKMVSKRLALCALLVRAAASFQRPGPQTRFRSNLRAFSSWMFGNCRALEVQFLINVAAIRCIWVHRTSIVHFQALCHELVFKPNPSGFRCALIR